MNRLILFLFSLGLVMGALLLDGGRFDIQAAEVKKDDRCPVCGMFVANYPNWLTRIHHADGTIHWFDGAKDMLAYYFDPGKFGPQSPEAIREIWVKDYYSLAWVPGREAYFVTGSDVHGPMGHEFIPFASKEAAENFLKDHKGTRVWSFGEITAAEVDLLRSGHQMKKHGQHGQQQQMQHNH
jgi:copper chaperone NosL